MRTYKIVMRNSTVLNTHYVAKCNAKRAKKYVAKLYADDNGWSLYYMWKTGK